MIESSNTNDRRQSEDRRTRGERRRGGDGRRVVLHVGRTRLHLALAVADAWGAPDLLHCASIDWRESGPSLPDPQAFELFEAKLKELVAQERVAGAAASLVINGDLSVNRVASGPVAGVRKSLEEIDERSQMYLSLGPGAKTVVTSRVNVDARHERAVVSVACESTIERLVEIGDAAGLELKSIEAESVALARAHGALHPGDTGPVLVVQCDENGFEIVVAYQGGLLHDYRPRTGGRASTLDDVLKQHHTRLQRFCQRQLGDFGLKLQKVYLAGPPEQVAHALDGLRGNDDYTAKPMKVDAARAHWNRSPELLDSDAAALVGRMLQEVNVAPEAPSPNLIERWIAESRKHIRPMLIRSALPLAAVILLAAAVGLLNWRVAAQVDRLDAELAVLAPAKIEHDALRLKIIAAQDKLQRLQQLSKGFTHRPLTEVLSSLGGCLPDDVWLGRVDLMNLASARVSGSSYSESGVYDFVRHLNAAPHFDQVALEGTGFASTQQGPATSFDLKFVLASASSKPEQETSQ